MSRFSLGRRTFLRGSFATGAMAAVGLPLLESMLSTNGTALADGGALPVRFSVWFWGNGSQYRAWAPTGTGAGWTPSAQLAPLASSPELRDYMNVVSGTTLPINFWGPDETRRRNPHVEGVTAILTGTNPLVDPRWGGADNDWDFMNVGAPSLDELAADVLQARFGPSRFRSIVTAVTGLGGVAGSAGTAIKRISHTGPGRPNDPIMSPRALFDRLFGGGLPTIAVPPTDDEIARASVLDVVLDDARALRGRLGAADRGQLDAHLENIRELELRLTGTTIGAAGDACVLGGAPMDASDYRNLARQFAEVTALAFACDLTRVSSMQFSSPGSHTGYPELGGFVYNGNNVSFHEYEHNARYDGTTLRVHTYLTELFAQFVDVLRNTREATGNLLDQSIVFGTTDVAGGWRHENDDWPLLVAGRGGGALRFPGVHVREDSNTARIGNTLLKALGSTEESWGQDQFASSDPFDILA